MKRYLVPYDGSEYSRAAVKYACQFAKGVPGSIFVRYIADERAIANPVFDLTVLALQAVGTLGDLIPREKAKLELKARLVSHGEELLADIAGWKDVSSEKFDDFDIITNVVVANPPQYLVEKSKEFDAIFMGLYGEMRAYKGGLWGGTSEAVIRKGECPVLIATSEFRKFDSVIVGFDNLPRSRQALAWAGIIGENMNIPVKVLTAESDAKKLDEINAEYQAIAQAYKTEFSYESCKKSAADFILEHLEQNPDALACLGAFGDQPLRELFLGSVAEAVLRKSKNPVMLFK